MTLRNPPARLLALAMLAPAACVASDEPPGLGTTEQAVEDGIYDVTGKFPGVGRLWFPGAGMCSGTLVAKNKVLTAKHCVEGLTPGATIWFSLSADATTFGAPRDYPASAVVLPDYWSDGHAVDFWWNDDDLAHDVAIVVLDRPVPLRLARPHPVSGINGTPMCSFDDDGLGTLVGYGPTTENGGPSGLRTYASAEGWELDLSTDTISAVWDNAFSVLGDQAGSSLQGDSGGPLFAGEPFGHDDLPVPVCGVTSGNQFGGVEVTSIEAATHLGGVRDFLQRELAGVRYDCWVPPAEGGDLDGDEVADGCDVCPVVQDDDQADSDRDGRGDACDNCLGEHNPGWKNHSTFGQLEADGLSGYGDVPDPTLPFSYEADRSWASRYPGDACTPDPITALSVASSKSFQVDESPRLLYREHLHACPGSSSHPNTFVAPAIDNVLLASSFVGGAQDQLGNTRVLFCHCALDDDRQCEAMYCPRSSVSDPDPATWKTPTLYDATTRQPMSVTNGTIPTKHVALRPVTGGATPRPAPVRPPPEQRELGWAYWIDYSPLAAPAEGTYLISQPMVWAWTRNFGTTRPSAVAAITSPDRHVRRQSMVHMRLEEHFGPISITDCPEASAGDLERGFRVPYADGNCPECGPIAILRILRRGTDRMIEYAARHAGVRGVESVMTRQLADVLADDDVSIVTAVDHAMRDDQALAVVYRISTHDVIGTVVSDGGVLALRELDVPAYHLANVSLGEVAAMSATRNEVAFFDAFNYANHDYFAIRTIDLDTAAEARSALIPLADLPGAIAGAAYRAQDDAYFVLTRSRHEVTLLRISSNLHVDKLMEFAVPGVKVQVDLHISEDGVLAITRRGADDFDAVVLAVDTATLEIEPVAHVSGEGRLALGATLTREGLVLERTTTTGPVAAYPLIQQGEPDVVYHDVPAGAWMEIFQ